MTCEFKDIKDEQLNLVIDEYFSMSKWQFLKGSSTKVAIMFFNTIVKNLTGLLKFLQHHNFLLT